MKQTQFSITAVLLLVLFLLPAVFTAAAADPASFEVTATELDGVGDDENGDGVIFLFEGDAKSDRVVASEEHNLRYMYLLVFDRYGSCVQLGNNLVFASVDAAFQNYVVIPKGGFMVAFYYNDSFPKNKSLFDYYKSLESILSGKTENIYNRTLSVESDYTASFKKMKINLTYGTEGAVLADCTNTDPDDTGSGNTDIEPPPEDVPEGSVVVRILDIDKPCSYVNGEVAVIHNETSVAEEYLSDDWNFRYIHLMVFDADGLCVQSGNNLVQASVDKTYQNGVKVPAGGFIAAFYYHPSEANKNEELFRLYDDANGNVTLYNETVKPLREVRAREEGSYLVLWMPEEPKTPSESSGEPAGADDPSEGPAESSEDSADPSEDSRDVSEESAVASEEPAVSSDGSSDSAAEGSETEPSGSASAPDGQSGEEQAGAVSEPSAETSAGDSRQETDPESGFPTVLVVLLCAAGAAAVAAVVVVLTVKKKKA